METKMEMKKEPSNRIIDNRIVEVEGVRYKLIPSDKKLDDCKKIENGKINFVEVKGVQYKLIAI